jgi:hypothetical protein
MNSTQDVVIPGGEAEEAAAAEVAQIAAVVSKPKRTARSRELALLLENITNLAPSPVNSSDRDSSDDASVPRRLANRPKSGKANKRFSAPQVQPSAATATLEHLVTVSDAAAKMEPPFSCGPCAPSRDADDAGQSAGQGNSCDKMHPEQSQPHTCTSLLRSNLPLAYQRSRKRHQERVQAHQEPEILRPQEVRT